MENVLNFLLCSLGAFVCICRVGKMHDAKMPMRVRYTLWATMLAASSISPVWGFEASWFQILFALCVLVDLGLGYSAWRNGQPGYVRANETATSAT